MGITTGWFIIINPTANNMHCAEEWVKIKAILDQKEWQYTAELTSHEGHATKLAEYAISIGFRKFIAIGGTGTCNEVVNSILKQQYVPSTDISFSVIPQGGRGAWARFYEIPIDYVAWLEDINEERFFIQDVGLVTYTIEQATFSRYFINVAGLLFDAFLVKKNPGHYSDSFHRMLYKRMIASEILRYRSNKVTIEYNGKELTDYFFNINIGIGQYTGGSLKVLPQAKADDGLLSISHDVGHISKIKRLDMFIKLSNGKYEKAKGVHFDTCPSFSIKPSTNAECFVEVDGEYIGYAPATFSVVPKALKVLVPSSFSV